MSTDSKLKEQIDTLLQPMLKMRLFAAFNKSIVSADEILPFVPEHLEYMMKLENDGILFASGPFIVPDVIVGAGLTILRAANLEQAKQYMDDEPLIKRKLRSYEIWEWELREGRFNVSLDLGTGKYQVT